MQKKKLLFALPLITVLLTGCVGKKHYEAKDYMIPVPWKGSGDFKILQLSDIHLSQSDIFEEHFDVIDRTIEASDPNLIVLNGDIFTFADKHVVNKVFSHIDSHNIMWTFTFGNHDDQGYYNDMYIPRLLASKKYTHCLFKNLEDDDVTGRTNFVLNLKDTNLPEHDVIYQIYLIDSHSYNFDTGEYDFIKQDQIDWYERVAKYSQETFGSDIRSSMYMHIGFPEFISSWEGAEENGNVLIGSMEEFEGSPSKDLGFFNKIKELGSTQSVSVAHDHANDSVVKYEGLYLCYGVHSTDRIYNDMNGTKLGGQVISINKATKKLKFSNYYGSYNSDEIKVIEKAGE